eukprot:385279-Amphidinium_carterae.1
MDMLHAPCHDVHHDTRSNAATQVCSIILLPKQVSCAFELQFPSSAASTHILRGTQLEHIHLQPPSAILSACRPLTSAERPQSGSKIGKANHMMLRYGAVVATLQQCWKLPV